MYQGYLIFFGSIFLLACPVFIPVVLVGLCVLYMYNPDLFRRFVHWLAPARLSKTAKPETTEKKTFETTKERQEREMSRIINPNYDPWSPENKERTQRLHNLLERNRRMAEKELRDQIERENIEKARKAG